jgi:hypothetical protein
MMASNSSLQSDKYNYLNSSNSNFTSSASNRQIMINDGQMFKKQHSLSMTSPTSPTTMPPLLHGSTNSLQKQYNSVQSMNNSNSSTLPPKPPLYKNNIKTKNNSTTSSNGDEDDCPFESNQTTGVTETKELLKEPQQQQQQAVEADVEGDEKEVEVDEKN